MQNSYTQINNYFKSWFSGFLSKFQSVTHTLFSSGKIVIHHSLPVAWRHVNVATPSCIFYVVVTWLFSLPVWDLKTVHVAFVPLIGVFSSTKQLRGLPGLEYSDAGLSKSNKGKTSTQISEVEFIDNVCTAVTIASKKTEWLIQKHDDFKKL